MEYKGRTAAWINERVATFDKLDQVISIQLGIGKVTGSL